MDLCLILASITLPLGAV